MKSKKKIIGVILPALLLISNVFSVLDNTSITAGNQIKKPKTAGFGWSAPYLLSNGSIFYNDPLIDIDPNGNIHVIWCDRYDYGGSGSDRDIFHRVLNISNNKWSNIELVSTESTGWSQEPDMKIDSAGNIHVVWRDATAINESELDYDIFYKCWNSTTKTWGPVEVVSTESNESTYCPELALDSAGNIHVVWADDSNLNNSGTDRDIFYKYRNSTSKTWSGLKLISNESDGYSIDPSIKVDENGNVHIVWCDDTNFTGCGTDQDIFYRFWNSTSKKWSNLTVLSPYYKEIESKDCHITIDGKSNIYISWIDGILNAYNHDNIIYKYYNSSKKSWSGLISITDYDISDVEYHKIAFDKNNNMHVIWTQKLYDYTLEINHVYHKFYNSTAKTWSNIFNISKGCKGDPKIPSIAIDDKGFAHCVWNIKFSEELYYSEMIYLPDMEESQKTQEDKSEENSNPAIPGYDLLILLYSFGLSLTIIIFKTIFISKKQS